MARASSPQEPTTSESTSAGVDSTSAFAFSNAARFFPNVSRGHCAVISRFSAGFRSVGSGVSAAVIKVPISAATRATVSKIRDGATGLTPSRQWDVEQKRCVRARVTAT